MDVCAILLSVGLTVLCPTPPTPAVDPAAEELKAMQEEMRRQDEQAQQKIDRLYRGLGDGCPECGKPRLDPRTLTRGHSS
jgi:hypothetical protein